MCFGPCTTVERRRVFGADFIILFAAAVSFVPQAGPTRSVKYALQKLAKGILKKK